MSATAETRDCCCDDGRGQTNFKISASSVKRLHTLRTLPERYAMREAAFKRRLHLTCYQEVLSLQPMGNGHGSVLKAQPHLAFMSCCAFPHFYRATRAVQNGVSCAGCQLAVEEADDSGDAMFRRRELVFSQAGFEEHFTDCEESQKLWESGNGGTIEPDNLPQFCKEGGYFSTVTQRDRGQTSDPA